jgi:two-component system, NarL family, nitrate/nitrite response regulator NarL
VVILTAFLESAFVFRALAAGARAFLSKDADRADVRDAILAVADGKVVIPPVNDRPAAVAEAMRRGALQ